MVHAIDRCFAIQEQMFFCQSPSHSIEYVCYDVNMIDGVVSMSHHAYCIFSAFFGGDIHLTLYGQIKKNQ